MSNPAKLNKARQQLIDIFLKCLEEDSLPWRRGWNSGSLDSMYNAVSDRLYRGVNALLLMFVSFERGYNDPRWCTFKQAEEKGWKIKKGSKGVPVEFWSYYDKKYKETISIREYNHRINHLERDKDEFSILSRTFTVFNGSCIDGIPALEVDETSKLSDIEMNQFVAKAKENMKVGYREVGDKAYYTPSKDMVTMPPRELFHNQYEFDSTLLHELSHATGHKSRLDRDIQNFFGTEKYAIEELRAEMSSAFLCSHLGIEMSSEHLDNHKAYIQSWGKDLKEDPNLLFRAIKDAETISDYLMEMGEYEKTRVPDDVNEKHSLDMQIQKAKEAVEVKGTTERKIDKEFAL